MLDARMADGGRPGRLRGGLRWLGLPLLLAALLALLLAAAGARAAGVTNSGDDLRDGWYPEQGSLSPQLVSGGTFGQLWSASVEGQVYAQPLLANGTLLVATENNKVYGLDPATGSLKWPAPLNLGTPWKPADIGCADLTPSIGVTATPVIDPATNTAYMTHKTYASGSSGPARWYMDAVDLSTGTEKPGFPVALSGAAQNQPGVNFAPTTQLQRPGLLLMEGVVYAAFGSHCDVSPWQGWVFGVSTSGVVRARWVSVANGNGAGIWQSGNGLASDGAGSILLSTGNGGAPSTATPGTSPPASLGESVVRLRVQADGSLKAVDFFAPFDASVLDSWDADFASGGVTGLNDQYFGTPSIPHLAVAVGKAGYVYLLNRDELGGIMQGAGGSDKVVQRIGPYGGVWSRPGVWPGDGGWVYIPTASGGNSSGGSSGLLQVYQYGLSGTGQPTLSLRATSTDAFGFSSSAPVITSEGITSGSALVWTIWASGGSGAGAQLRAYDPIPVNGHPVLRWSAPVGTSSKFAPPGVGGGRIFVGNREGKVLAFGAPVAAALTGPTTSFPTTTLGASSEKTVTLTATGGVTISQVSSSSTQFAVGAPSAALPAQLSAGQTITVPVTFKPSQTGLVAASLNVETDKGPFTFALSGTGQAQAAKLEAAPPLVSFGGTTVGGHLSGTATFRNVGGEPLTITSLKLPGAPFSASGAPAVGATIAAGSSVTVNVSFDPTQTGSFTGEIAMETTGGNGAVGLSGSAAGPGALQITSETNELGGVAVGSSATRSFTIKNTGGTAVTITKSKPPSGGAFSATTSLPEGTTVAPGETLTETVLFTPTAAGWAAGAWIINGNDSTGLHEVSFGATGTVPAPGAAWTHNGSATFPSAGVLQSTAAVANQAGTGFYPSPVETRHLVVEFDATTAGGTGGYGQALVLADASAATPAALGKNGSGLGFSGIPGIAVALDTHGTSVDPSSNFVGVTDGPVSKVKPRLMHWLATSTAIPALRPATRHVRVEVLNGNVTVQVEGVQVISTPAVVPAKVLIGFSGGTGSATDIHQAGNVSVSGDTPIAPTLALHVAVKAPSGSPQAASQMSFAGKCPSAFTTAAVGDGAAVAPALSGAAPGATCEVAETIPAEAGWSVTASVNGSEVPVTVSGTQAKIAGFPLLAGANSVTFTATYTPPVSLVPDPTAGGWQLNGSASLAAPELVLTTTAANQAGSAFWPQQVSTKSLTVEFDASIGGGSGADGLTLTFADPSRGAAPTSLGAVGGGLGFSGIPGVAVALDTYRNAVNPSANFVGITDGPGTQADYLHWTATTTTIPELRTATRHVKVQVAAGTMTVSIGGSVVLSTAVSLPPTAYLGFTGATGGSTDRHAISHLFVGG